MIDYVIGTLTEKNVTEAIVETHGIGYAIHIPLSTYEKLPAPGQQVRLVTFDYLREDTHKLFGFCTKLERELFQNLIGVSKIGPKVALSIMSGLSINALIECIDKADAPALSKIPGVGAKTAQRLVVELQGKFAKGKAKVRIGVPVGSGVSIQQGVKEEVYEAMLALGYNDKQVIKAIEKVGQKLDSESPVEDWIKQSLQVI